MLNSRTSLSRSRSFVFPRFAVVLASLLLLPASLSALPREAVYESSKAKVTIDLADAKALLSSIECKATGEALRFASDSADFAIETDKGRFTRADFKVANVASDETGTYVVLDGDKLSVAERYTSWPSGAVRRTLQLTAKEPIFIEKVSPIELTLADQPEWSLNHTGRFLGGKKGGFFLTVELPDPARNINFGKDLKLRSGYQPEQQLQQGESIETAAAILIAWSGDKNAGYDAVRDYSYDLSGWRNYATVRTSSASKPALTTAYDGYKAIDDDPNTRWRSDTNMSGEHWIEIEFPHPVVFDTFSVSLDNEEQRPILEVPKSIAAYHLQTWSENGWRDIATGATLGTDAIKFPETRSGKVRLLVTGCYGQFSLWDLRLYRDTGDARIIRENLCSRFWPEEGVRMPLTYFNTWYIRHPGAGRYYRARGLLTYDMDIPLMPLAAQCGMANFVLDAGWKYSWYGLGANPKWEVEFPEGMKPFSDAAQASDIRLAGWWNFFWIEGKSRDHQWRAVTKDGRLTNQMCILSDYYSFLKSEMLSQIRNSGMITMKIDGFVPPDECWAKDHSHKPGELRDAGWLASMRLFEELKRQYPDYLLGVYTWDPFWTKYSEIVHTYEDHGGLTPGELAPTRAKMQYMHDREMFNEAYWRYLVHNQVEGSTIITDRYPEWREEVIGNLAGPTRRQISCALNEFSSDERKWIGDCMNWSRVNARFLEHLRPFFPNPKIKEPWGLTRNRGMETSLGVDVVESNSVEGYAHILDNEGYIFIFNPTFHPADYTIPVSEQLGFTKDAAGLSFQIIYPYLQDLASDVAFGKSVTGLLPAEKHIVIRARKQAIPALIPNSRCVVEETIWDNVKISAQAEPTATGGPVRTRLIPPKDAQLDSVTMDGIVLSPSADGSYELTLQAPKLGSVESSTQPATAKSGKRTASAEVTVSGDLVDPKLMLFLRRPFPNGKQALPKAAPEELDFTLTIDGKPVIGALDATFAKDWEPEKNAGWWTFALPEGKRRFRVTVECAEKVEPFVVLSAIQQTNRVSILANYSRTKPGPRLTSADPESFFHTAFPEEREYFALIEP